MTAAATLFARWDFLLLLCASAVAVPLTLTNPAISLDFRRIALPLIGFLAVPTAVATLILVLQSLLAPESRSPEFAVVLAALSCALLSLTVWFHPSRIALRSAALAVLLLFPTVLAVHLVVTPEYSELHNKTHGRPTNASPVTVSKLADFFFLDSSPIICAPDASDCLNAVPDVMRLRSRKSAFFGRLVYAFLVLFFPLRYLGTLFERNAIASADEGHGWELQQKMLAQSAASISGAIAGILAMFAAGVDFKQLGLFGGLIGAGLAVALRDTLGNLAAGLIILSEGRIKKNDVITIENLANPEVGGSYGVVDEVRPRYTVIKDRDTVNRLIPNSTLITEVIENWTHGDSKNERKVRLKIDVPVPYGCPIKLVANVLEGVCYEEERVLTNPPPKALIKKLGDSAIVFTLRFWIRDPEQGIRNIISQVYMHTLERLLDIGISVPFPQIDVHLSHNETSRNLATRALAEDSSNA